GGRPSRSAAADAPGGPGVGSGAARRAHGVRQARGGGASGPRADPPRGLRGRHQRGDPRVRRRARAGAGARRRSRRGRDGRGRRRRRGARHGPATGQPRPGPGPGAHRARRRQPRRPRRRSRRHAAAHDLRARRL
ncbi:MAG: hypothetical protein AVDCRST_MAG65-343, partial [uncultured Solirubrobacteraceae bacterium]